jgi:hypothetical protein
LDDIRRGTLKPIKPELLVLQRTSKGDRGVTLPAAQFGLELTDGDDWGLGNLGYFVHLLHFTGPRRPLLQCSLRAEEGNPRLIYQLRANLEIETLPLGFCS